MSHHWSLDDNPGDDCSEDNNAPVEHGVDRGGHEQQGDEGARRGSHIDEARDSNPKLCKLEGLLVVFCLLVNIQKVLAGGGGAVGDPSEEDKQVHKLANKHQNSLEKAVLEIVLLALHLETEDRTC